MKVHHLNIAIVEDEAFIALNMKQQLTKIGYTIFGIYANGEKLLQDLVEIQPDIILMDISLGGKLDGIETAMLVQDSYDIPVIYVSALSDKETFARVIQNNPYGYITKPLNFTRIPFVIELAYSKHKMDVEIKQREVKYRMLFEKMSNGICVVAPQSNPHEENFRIVETNIVFNELINKNADEVLGCNIYDLFEVSGDLILTILTDTLGNEQQDEKVYYFPEFDKHFSVQTAVYEDGHIIVLLNDVSDKIKYEENLYLASMGRISTAITHEINQPLQSIKVLADSALYLYQQGKEIQYGEVMSDLEEISKRVDRIEGIIKTTKCLHNKPNIKSFCKINLNEDIQSIFSKFRKKFESMRIVVEMDLHSSEPEILASDVMLEQMLSNLINNSIHAFAKYDVSERKIQVQTEVEADKVVLLFSDNGPGISDDLKGRIFKPHVSENQSEENMGMGLYIVKCMMNQLNGSADCYDHDPVGVTFCLKIPVYGEDQYGT